MIGPRGAVTIGKGLDPERPINRTLRWLRQARGIEALESRYVDEEDVWNHYVRDVYARRIREKRDTVTIVTGEPSTGKSTLALRLAIAISEELHRPFDLRKNVVYRQSELFERLENARGDVLSADEGVLSGGQARAGMPADTVLLDRAFSICRIQGVTLFLLVPSIWGVATAARERRARFWMHCEERGRATVLELSDRLQFKRTSELPFWKVKPPWRTLHWDSLEGTPVWEEYERIKLARTKSELGTLRRLALRVEKANGAERDPHDRVPGETTKERERRLARLRLQSHRARHGGEEGSA